MNEETPQMNVEVVELVGLVKDTLMVEGPTREDDLYQIVKQRSRVRRNQTAVCWAEARFEGTYRKALTYLKKTRGIVEGIERFGLENGGRTYKTLGLRTA